MIKLLLTFFRKPIELIHDLHRDVPEDTHRAYIDTLSRIATHENIKRDWESARATRYNDTDIQ